MRLYLTAAAFIALQTLFAQETKQVEKESNEDDNHTEFSKNIPVLEVYSVLHSNPKIKHGPYIKYDISSQKFQHPGERITRKNVDSPILESGRYSQGKKNGPWQSLHHFYETFPNPDKAVGGKLVVLINQPYERGEYVDGKKNGIWFTYYINWADDLEDSLLSNAVRDMQTAGATSSAFANLGLKVQTVGQYLDDKPIGEWSYYERDEVLQHTYDFSKDDVIYDIRCDSTTLHTNRPALFVGGSVAHRKLSLEKDRPIEMPSGGKKSLVTKVVTLTIDPTGKVTHIDVAPKDAALKREFQRLYALPDFRWVPALKDGIPIPFIYTITIEDPKSNGSVPGK